MFLILTDLVMVAQRWEEIPHRGLYTPKAILHWMEDVAQGGDWRTPKYDAQPSLFRRPPLAPWMLGILGDDVMLGFDGDDGICFHLDAIDDFERGCSMLPPPFHLR
jgi:hypothetical protein